MKKKPIVLSCLLLATLAVGVGCTNTTPSGEAYPERQALQAQVGYDYELPDWLLEAYSSFSVKDAAGNELSMKGNSVFFDTLGKYTVSCTNGEAIVEIPLTVYDTEEPSLQEFNSSFTDLVAASFSYGDELDLDDVFIPCDNSGSATATYTVYEMGNKVELQEGNILVCGLKNVGYYSVETVVTDASGNSACYTYRIQSEKWYDPALGQNGKTFICGTDYKLGDFALVSTDLPDGTVVRVDMEMMFMGLLAEKEALWTRYTNQDGEIDALTQPWHAKLYTNVWKETSFMTIVKDGKIWLEVRTNAILGGYTGTIEVQNLEITDMTGVRIFTATGGTQKYNLGEFAVAESDLADGTVVDVTMKLQMAGRMFENKGLFLRVLSADATTWETLIEPWATAPYAEYKEITFTTVVKDGKVVLEVRSSQDANASCIVQVKDVVVTEKTITPDPTPDPEPEPEPDPTPDEDILKFEGTGAVDAYNLGNFEIADTDFAEGTVVVVTMKLKYSGKMFANKWLWARYTDSNGSMEALTQPDSSSSVYAEFTEVSFTTLVGANGEITLEIRNSNGGSAAYCVEVKDVVVAEPEKVLKYEGTGAVDAYNLGNFEIADTDFAEGTVVTVTMKLKLAGQMATNGWLWTRYLSTENSWEELSVPGTQKYKDFAEVTFTTVVGADGKIVIEVRNSNGGSAAYSVQVKDVTVTEVTE